MAKHSPQLAQHVVDCGALEALVICLEEFDPGVKEAAAWALGYVARHNGGNSIKHVLHPALHGSLTAMYCHHNCFNGKKCLIIK